MRKLFFMLLLAAITSLTGQALNIDNTAGQLAQAVDGELDITTLVVNGTIDARDFQFITNNLDELTTLDLSNATIVAFNKGTALYGTVTDYAGNMIPRTAFFGKKLTSVTLPANLEAIGYAAFAGCYQLQQVTIPETVAFIDDYAFAGSALTTVTVPQSVEVMGKGVFSRCEAMTSAVIESRFIGDFAFLGDYALSNVTVGPRVNMIGRGAFNGCTALQTLNLDPACRMSRIDEEAFINSGLADIDVRGLGLGTIGDWAFAQTQLSHFNMSREMTTLGEGVLAHNPQLASVVMPTVGHASGNNTGRGNNDSANPRLNAPGVQRTLNKVPDFTFAGDGNLNPGKMLRQGVEEIGNYAFYNVSADIDTMRLPASVAYLGDRAMAGMTGMRTLKVDATSVPDLGNEVWAGVNQSVVPLITPSESTVLYKEADQWMNFFFEADFLLGDVNGDGVVAISDVTVLIDYLLSGSGDINELASDLNGDGSVSISDVTALTDMLLSGGAKGVAKFNALGDRISPTSDALAFSAVSLAPGETRTIEVALNSDEREYLALQCSLILPEGVELVAVNGIERGNNHIYAMRHNGEETNAYSLIGVSMNLDKYAGHEGNIMSLTLAASDEFDGRDAELMLTEVILVDTHHKMFAAGNSLAKVDEATAIEQVNANKEIASVRYINVAGQESERPFDGINIVVTTYNDGTTTTTKVLK